MKLKLKLITLMVSASASCFVYAQSEQQSFTSGPGYKSRIDACAKAKDNGMLWVKQNTERFDTAFAYNQVRRGWPAKLDNVGQCDCERDGDSFKCSVDIRISRDK